MCPASACRKPCQIIHLFAVNGYTQLSYCYMPKSPILLSVRSVSLLTNLHRVWSANMQQRHSEQNLSPELCIHADMFDTVTCSKLSLMWGAGEQGQQRDHCSADHFRQLQSISSCMMVTSALVCKLYDNTARHTQQAILQALYAALPKQLLGMLC